MFHGNLQGIECIYNNLEVIMDECDTELAHTVSGFDPHTLFKHGFTVKSIDLVQGGSFEEVIGRTIPCLWMAIKNKDGKNYFSGISIILPPKVATTLTSEFVLQSIASGIMALRGYKVDLEELEVLNRIVRVVNCSTLEVSDLVEKVDGEGPFRLVGIAEASIYRDKNIVHQPVFGVSVLHRSEDRWTKHVVSLCRQCVTIAKNTEGYTLLHVADTPAIRPENEELLVGVDDCYVSCLSSENNPEDIFNQNAESWLAMALSGEITEVVKEVEKLELPEVTRLLALAQLFQRAGENEEALEFIEQIQPHTASLTSIQLIKLSRVAYKAGDDSLASSLLPDDGSNIADEMWLETALELATYCRDNEKIEHFDAQLAFLFPHSDVLKENRDRRLLLNCRKAKQGEEYIFTTAGFTERHLTLLDGMYLAKPSYQRVIQEADSWGEAWVELAMICCAIHANSVGHLRVAADIASQITESELYGRQAAKIVLASSRIMMLKEDVRKEERDYYRAPLLAVVRFLAKHPEDGEVRSELSKLLSVESCGDLGIPIIALIMLDLATEGVSCAISKIDMPELNHENENNTTAPSEDTFERIVKEGLKWLQEKEAVEFGVTVLPAKIVGCHSDFIINYLSRIVLRIAEQESENTDLALMEQMVLLVCAISPHATKERNEDLRVIRLLAGHYAIAGQFQQARNLAEQVLLMGKGSKIRLRLAWLAFADIYHRCHNKVEALAGLSCAMATNVAIEKADLWQEVYAAVRILRDLGLFEYARKFMPALKRLLSDCGLDPETDPRIITTELGLRFSEIKNSSFDSGELHSLINELTLRCKHDIAGKADLLPLAILLGQAVRKADNVSIDVSLETRNVLNETLNLLGQRDSEMVKVISSIEPQPVDVVALFNRVERATFTKDTAGDYTFVRLAAHRLLDCHSQQALTVETKILAIELLTDHTLVLPDTPPDMKIDWPICYAQSLNQEGLDVVFLAIDNNGELIVNYVSGGQALSVEQPRHQEAFRNRMLLWLEDYPRNYGYIGTSDGNNDFFNTMEELDICLPTSDMLVVVATPMMQQLTTNLVLVKPTDGGFSHFLGTKTAVGMVPSLTWLSRVRANVHSNKHGYKAWISAQDDPEDSGAMGIALTRLSGTFEDFGFTVDSGQRLPREMSNARLAVITAHGGLTSEGRYIHSIRDEGDLIEAPSELAFALTGVEVVILFVCSGGRIDNHPWDNRTVSLPKQLLDRGSRAVIASPWPLDVKVTYRWLEPFLNSWESGLTILQATKVANEAVSRALGDNPQYCLAMTVYGDVLLKR